MQSSDAPKARNGLWRIASIVLSAGLGLSAVCLVVFSTTQKQTQIGVLLGLWGGLIAAFVAFGSRRSQQNSDSNAANLLAAQQQAAELHAAQLEVARQVHASQEVELRRIGEVQLARQTAARREADFKLEMSLRHEIERVLAEQIGSLRDEVAALRAEVVDKLGGQLRLERIETTRLIGSDLEALQHEIRRLSGSRESLAAASAQPQPFDQPTTALPDLAEHDIVDAEVVEVLTPVAAPPPVTRQAPAPPPQPPPVPEPAEAAAQTTEPVPASSPPAESSDAFATSRDPFAGLPRLTPISEDVADLLLPTPTPTPETAEPEPGTAEPEESKASTARGGRRRAPDAEEVPVEQKYVGRRRASAEQGGPAPAAEPEQGGRRRASNESAEDLMARLRGR